MKSFFSLGVLLLLTLSIQAQNHVFKPLPYAYDALEPYLDKQTMEIHYSKHHQNYFNKFVELSKSNIFLDTADMKSIFARMSEFSDGVRNNGGGYWNHEFFWESMTANGTVLPEGAFRTHLMKQFGDQIGFETAFKKSALSLFGSGWTWLIVSEGQLKIVNTANQDNPLMNTAIEKGTPLLGIDVWEHAYYLKFQNKRSDYIDNFLKVINWQRVSERYQETL